MKEITIIKKDKDRQTELARITLSVPENLQELVAWNTGKTDIEKFLIGRKFEDYFKGMSVTVQSSIDPRKKAVDPRAKQLGSKVVEMDNSSDMVQQINARVVQHILANPGISPDEIQKYASDLLRQVPKQAKK